MKIRKFSLIFVCFYVLGSLFTCGENENDKKDVVNTGLVPADWDGQSDYASSTFRVVDDE